MLIQIINKSLRWTVLMLLFIAMPLPAADAAAIGIENPKVTLEKVSANTLAELRQKKEQLKNDPDALKKIIQERIFPHIDPARMARWALGKHWRRATKEQRMAFAREFELLLVRTYASALFNYIDAEIEFLPVHLKPDDRQVIVRSQINIASNPQPISLNYRLYLSNRQWRVYDISIEDVSLIASYRTTFSREIRRKGVTGLIESLRKRNQKAMNEKS